MPNELTGELNRFYEYVCRNFLASIAPQAEYNSITIQFDVNGIIFEEESSQITQEGFLSLITWKRGNYVKDFPNVPKDGVYKILSINHDVRYTQPPEYVTESELIKLMEKNKIGTDASMAVHIKNICDRVYVKVDASRKLIPTKLGVGLIESLSTVDPEIVQPSTRADIEGYVDMISRGQKRYDEVLEYVLGLYKKKWFKMRDNFDKIINAYKKFFDIDQGNFLKGVKDIRKNPNPNAVVAKKRE